MTNFWNDLVKKYGVFIFGFIGCAVLYVDFKNYEHEQIEFLRKSLECQSSIATNVSENNRGLLESHRTLSESYAKLSESYKKLMETLSTIQAHEQAIEREYKQINTNH